MDVTTLKKAEKEGGKLDMTLVHVSRVKEGKMSLLRCLLISILQLRDLRSTLNCVITSMDKLGLAKYVSL